MIVFGFYFVTHISKDAHAYNATQRSFKTLLDRDVMKTISIYCPAWFGDWCCVKHIGSRQTKPHLSSVDLKMHVLVLWGRPKCLKKNMRTNGEHPNST